MRICGVHASELPFVALQQVWLLTHLTYTLFCSFVFMHSLNWFVRFLRLMVFVALLFPQIMLKLYRYLTATNIVHQVTYGPNPRNYLDIHLPTSKNPSNKLAPVVVFITGGAWIIGYKAWNLFVAPQLNAAGIIVVSPDYRNFPQGTVGDMVEDGTTAVAWVKAHIREHGGDPRNITLCGQSAGAWMVAMMVIERARLEGTKAVEAACGWTCSDLRHVVGISGPYDMADPKQLQHMHSRGLYKSVLYSIFEGELSRWSPARAVRVLGPAAAAQLPPFLLMHGAADKTVPCKSSEDFCMVLKDCGVEARSSMFAHKSHTDGIIEDTMLRARNPIIAELVQLISAEQPNGSLFAETRDSEELKPTAHAHHAFFSYDSYPSQLVQLARMANPF